MADLCTATSIREGFGLNLVEAMASGLRIVATNNRGHRMIVNNDKIGFLVNIDNCEQFANKVNYFEELENCSTDFLIEEAKKYLRENVLDQIWKIMSE